MEQTIPTESQIEVIKSDWLHGTRDKNTYVHRNTKGAIITAKEGDAYSDYFLPGGLTTVELLKEGRQIAQNTVDILCPDPVKVALGGNASYTDGQQVNISSAYFDDPNLSNGQKVDILVGYSVHEASHILHSDFEALAADADKGGRTEKALRKDIANILEDERVEQLTGESAPGLMDYVAEAKKYTFSMNVPEDGKVTERIPSFLNALVKAVRFPSSLTDREVTEHYDALDRCRHILTPYPSSTAQILKATDDIVDVLKDMVKDEQEKQRQQQSQQQSGQSRSGSSDGQQGKPEGSPSAGADGSAGPQSQGDPKSPSAGSQGASAGSQQGQQAPKSLEDALGTLQGMQVREMLEKVASAAGAGAGNDCREVQGREEQSMYINGDADKCSTDSGKNCYFCRAKENRDVYQAAQKEVRKFIPAMARALTCQTREYDYELRGMEEGILDTSKFASLVAGNNRVFLQRGEVTTEGLTICILLDESGSMSRQKESAARQTAILINEAVKNNPAISLFVYGFTDDRMNVYCEPGTKRRYALGSTGAYGGTPTGMAMDCAAKRIRKRSSDVCVMFVITDGAPNDHVEVRQQDSLLRKQRIFPIGLGICGAPVGDFKEGISMGSELRTLPFEISRIINRKVKSFIRKNDTGDV